MSDEKPESKSLWTLARKNALATLGVVGIAMGSAAGMEGVIGVSTWVHYLIANYRAIVVNAYHAIERVLNINLPTMVWDILLLTAFYAGILIAQTRGKPVPVPLETDSQKLSYVLRHYPVSLVQVTTAFLFIGVPFDEVLIWVGSMAPFLLLMFLTISKRLKGLPHDPDIAAIRYLVSVWVIVGILILVSQTQVFEMLAGKPPPIPEVPDNGIFQPN